MRFPLCVITFQIKGMHRNSSTVDRHVPCHAVLCCLQLRSFMTAIGDYNCTIVPPSTPALNSTAPAHKGGRRLLQQQQHQRSLRGWQSSSPARGLQQAAAAEPQYSCKKLEAGGCLLVCVASPLQKLFCSGHTVEHEQDCRLSCL